MDEFFVLTIINFLLAYIISFFFSSNKLFIFFLAYMFFFIYWWIRLCIFLYNILLLFFFFFSLENSYLIKNEVITSPGWNNLMDTSKILIHKRYPGIFRRFSIVIYKNLIEDFSISEEFLLVIAFIIMSNDLTINENYKLISS